MVFLIVLAVVVAVIVLTVISVKKNERKKAEEKEKAEILRKQQEEQEAKEAEERRKAEEEKWQEDIRTGKVDFGKAEVFFNNGTMLMNSGKNAEAIEQYNKAIEFNPRYKEAYCNRGIVYKRNGDIDKAIDDYHSALRLYNNDDAEISYNLGRAYMDKDDFSMASIFFTQSINARSFYSLSNLQKVEIYINRGISKSNDAITPQNNYPDFRVNSQICEAAGDWIQALRIEPDNDFAKGMLNKFMNYSLTVKRFIELMLEQYGMRL
jgi:tetratricopeptide (TPR) repeat protein